MITDPITLIVYFPVSIIIFLLCFYIPARVVLRHINKFTSSESFAISISLGMSMWMLTNLVLGYSNLRMFTYVYLIGFGLLWLREIKTEIKIISNALKDVLSDKWLLLLMIVGIPIATSSLITSGLPLRDGIGFYGINPIDGSFHIALARSITQKIPPIEPGISGMTVQNYHYLFDLLLSEIYRIFRLPIVNLYYHYFPIFMAFIYGYSAYVAMRSITKDKNSARIFTFFIYFAGTIGFVFMFLLTGKLDFTVNSLDNSVSVFVNPQRVLAQTILIAGLIPLSKWMKTRKLSYGYLCAILFGGLVGIKVYVGIFASLGLLVVSAIFFLRRKYGMILPVFISAAISALVYFPVNIGAGGLVYVPFAWPHHFFAQGTAGQLMWQHQMDVFVAHSNKLRIYLLNIQMSASFVVILFGTRLLGLIGSIVAWTKIDRLLWTFLVIPAGIFVVISLFFLQESGPYEVFNFIAVSTLIGSFFASILLSEMWLIGQKSHSSVRKLAAYGFVVVILLLTVPRSLHEAYKYFNLMKLKSGYLVDQSDLEMFRLLESAPNGLVLVDLKDQLNAYSPYVSAFTGKQMYFSGEGIMRAHGLSVDTRHEIVKNMFAQSDHKQLSNMLGAERIKYVYLIKPYSEIFDKLDHNDIYEDETVLLMELL